MEKVTTIMDFQPSQMRDWTWLRAMESPIKAHHLFHILSRMSFSGEDVRKSFLSHFLEKLQRKSIITFIDHGIERSRPIALELLSAIRESRISIVIFSKKYASSTWCLNELVQIHKCYEELGQMVIPVFYDVDPSDVRKQTGEFGKAFETTCKDKKEDDKKRWKIALAEVAGIAGEDSRNWSDEAKMIEQISNDVSNKLFTPSDDFCDYVGIQAHVDKLTVLDMSGCTSLELSTSIGYLDLSDTAEEVPSWIKNIVWLIELRMRGCEKLKAISANIWNLEHIDYVDFTDCGGVTSISDASLVKTVAELHEEMYLFCSDSYTKFLFHNCFNFDQDAQKFMLQSYSRFTVLPGKEVPTYFRHQTCGSSLIVPLPQSSLSQKDLEFTICIIPEPATDFQHSDSKIIVHWKFRGVKGVHKVKLDMDAAKMDHLVMFHFDICLGEERLDPPSQLDCNNMGFEFAFHYTTGLGNILTFSLLPIIGCGV